MWVLILGAIIVGALFVLPPALKAGQDAWNKAWKDFWSLFDNLDNKTDTSTTSTGSLSFEIVAVYSDGSRKSFKSEALTILPITIYDPSGGKQVVEWIVNINVATTYKGTPTSWSCSGNLIVTVDDDLRTKTLLTVTTLPFSHTDSTGSIPESGATRTTGMLSVKAATVDTAIRESKKAGIVFSVGFAASLTVTTIIDGQTQSLSGSNKAYANILYEETGLEQLSVTVVTTTIHSRE